MKRSTFIALVVGAAAGLGVQLAIAQPVDWSRPTFQSVTVRSLVKVSVVDAGVMNVAGQFCAFNNTLCATASGVNIATDLVVAAGNDVTFNRDLRVEDDFKLSGGVITDRSTDPTVTACSGGTAASITAANGTAAFVFDVGTACAAESTAVLTMPAATTGYVCNCTSTTADRVLQQKAAGSTTSVTIQNIVMSTGANGDWTDGADVFCLCRGY